MIHDAVWYCNDCKHTFEEPKKIPGHGCVPHDWDSPDEYVCPYCDSDDFQLADWCAECDCVFPQSELQDGFCKDCIDKLIDEDGPKFLKQDEYAKAEFTWWLHNRLRKRGA